MLKIEKDEKDKLTSISFFKLLLILVLTCFISWYRKLGRKLGKVDFIHYMCILVSMVWVKAKS